VTEPLDSPVDLAERRWLALQGCEQIVSGPGPRSMRHRLETFLESGQGLDARPDMYGDGLVRALEERVAGLLGKPDAVYFPSGTMAQQVALRCWAMRTGTPAVAMHPLTHLEVHEREAFTVLSGLRPVWLTREPRQPTVDEVRDADEPFGTLHLELPLRDAGYLLPTFDELTGMASAARERGAFVHWDGARLWESTRYLGEDLSTVAGLADSVYVSFYKTLAALSGAAVAGPLDFTKQARAWRHRYGGNMFQQWPAALSAMIGLDTILPRLSSYVDHAREVAHVLAQLPGARVNPLPPHTHQFQLWLPGGADALNEATLALAEQEKVWFAGGWQDRAPTGLAMIEITIAEPALALSTTEVAQIAAAWLERVQAAAAV
jgi:threonine aldolase